MTPIFSSFQFKAVTPSDTVPLTYSEGGVLFRPKAFFVGGAGDLALVNSAGDAVTFENVSAGSLLPVSSEFVNSTNTTATNIVALF